MVTTRIITKICRRIAELTGIRKLFLLSYFSCWRNHFRPCRYL